MPQWSAGASPELNAVWATLISVTTSQATRSDEPGRQIVATTIAQQDEPDVELIEEIDDFDETPVPVEDERGVSADLVRAYLNGIGRTKLLTAAEEVDLSKRIE